MKKKTKKWHWPFLRINFGGDIELMCEHGVGHGGLHGCDGCCRDKEYVKRLKSFKRSSK
jgi:hypothetical protein